MSRTSALARRRRHIIPGRRPREQYSLTVAVLEDREEGR
jgi:hypothetical protein